MKKVQINIEADDDIGPVTVQFASPGGCGCHKHGQDGDPVSNLFAFIAAVPKIVEAISRATGGADPAVEGFVRDNQPPLPPAASDDSDGEAAPPAAPPDADPEEQRMMAHAARLQEGRERFAAFVSKWNQNFGVEDAPQPDRNSALMALTAYGMGPTLEYIASRGGLTGAVLDVLVSVLNFDPAASVRLAKRLAINIATVDSAMRVRILSDYLESSVDREKEIDDSPIRGPMRKDLSKHLHPDSDRPPGSVSIGAQLEATHATRQGG